VTSQRAGGSAGAGAGAAGAATADGPNRAATTSSPTNRTPAKR